MAEGAAKAILTGRKGKLSSMRRGEILNGYLYISPWLIGLVAFTAGPLLYSLILSFTDWDLFTSPNFVGLSNYINVFQDELFWQALKVTSIFVFTTVPLRLLFGLLIAVMMNSKVPGIKVFRTIFYLPSITSGVAVALLWLWIFDPYFGVMNAVLGYFGIQGPMWLMDPNWVLPAFVIMNLWGVGGTMVIYLAGLQGIPTQLYEAAEIDGANRWQVFWKVTIPMLSPVIFYNLVMGIIQTFQVFAAAFIMTEGGPHNASLFYVLYLYRKAFEQFEMGYASALAWILFVIILVCTLFVFKSSPMWVYYEGEVKKG